MQKVAVDHLRATVSLRVALGTVARRYLSDL